MSDFCNFCETRRPINGTKLIIMNGGSQMVEFCENCSDEQMTNDNGQVFTVEQIFNGDKTPLFTKTAEDTKREMFESMTAELGRDAKYKVWNYIQDFQYYGSENSPNPYNVKTYKDEIAKWVAWYSEKHTPTELATIKGLIYKSFNNIINKELNGIRMVTKQKPMRTSIGELLQA